MARSGQLNWLGVTALVLGLITIVILLDVPLERALSAVRLRGDLRRFFTIAESFGHGFGVLLILLAISTLHAASRPKLLRLAACAFGAGLIANVVKLFVSRQRPYSLDLDVIQTWDSFNSLIPFAATGAHEQSFPSAHTATAAAFAVGLIWLYPQGRCYFSMLAVGVAFQRMLTGAHFPSDVLVGGLIGVVWARLCLGKSRVGVLLGRAEQRLRR